MQKTFGMGGATMSSAPTGVVFYDSATEGATDADVAPALRAFGYQVTIPQAYRTFDS